MAGFETHGAYVRFSLGAAALQHLFDAFWCTEVPNWFSLQEASPIPVRGRDDVALLVEGFADDGERGLHHFLVHPQPPDFAAREEWRTSPRGLQRSFGRSGPGRARFAFGSPSRGTPAWRRSTS